MVYPPIIKFTIIDIIAFLKASLFLKKTLLKRRLVFPLPPANTVFAVGSDCRQFATITQIALNRFKPLQTASNLINLKAGSS